MRVSADRRGRKIPDAPFKMGQSTPVRINALSNPTPPQSSTKAPSAHEHMQHHLLRLERGLSDAMKQLSNQAETCEKEKAKAEELQLECERMTKIVQLLELKRIGMKDIGVQTVSAPAPLLLSVRRSGPVKAPGLHFVQAGRDIEPQSAKVDKENSPLKANTKFYRKSTTPKPPGATAHKVLEELHGKERDLMDSIHLHFDKLDGTNSKILSRDSCLLMASLLLEERGIRHASIPKVICSRMLKSMTQSNDGLTLHRELAHVFFQKVLEFIIEQEK